MFYLFLVVWTGMSSYANADESASSAPTNDTSATLSIPPLNFDVHGFFTQSFFKSSSNNYLSNSQAGSFDYSEAAVNFTKPLTDKIDVGAQLYAQKLGPNTGYGANFDWFYISYKQSNLFRIKIGRIKIPFGLYNESSDIDAARVPVLLPQSIYPVQDRNYLLAQNGAQVYGYLELGGMGALDYHVYGGSIAIALPQVTSISAIATQVDVPYIVGGRLLWETPLQGLKAAFTLQKLTLDIDETLGNSALAATAPVIQYVASLEYTFKRLTLASEYSRWYVTLDTSNPALIPDTSVTSARYYGMANYQLTDSFAPGAYYSVLTPDITNTNGSANIQKDLALYVRYDFNPYWLVKLEGHVMNGTAGLDPTLNNNQPLSALNSNWEFFILKTTAYF
jgi:hypothetical protein